MHINPMTVSATSSNSSSALSNFSARDSVEQVGEEFSKLTYTLTAAVKPTSSWVFFNARES